MISLPVSSIFHCSPLPSGTWRTPGLSFPWCCLPSSSSVCLVFFLLSLCFAIWFWQDLVSTHHWGGYLHSSKTRARWAQGFYDELIGHVFDLERDGLRQVVPCRHSPYDENKPVEYGNSVSPLSYVLIIFVRLSSQSSLLSRLFFNRSWILKSRQPHWDASRRRKTYSFLWSNSHSSKGKPTSLGRKVKTAPFVLTRTSV